MDNQLNEFRQLEPGDLPILQHKYPSYIAYSVHYISIFDVG